MGGYPGENKFGDDFDKMQEKLTERYTKFACMTSKPSRVSPVGEGFKMVEKLYGKDARLQLYEPSPPDNLVYHPSRAGSYLSACIHYLSIFGEGTTVVGNPYHGGLDSKTALKVQVAAEETWKNWTTKNGFEYEHDEDCTPSMCEDNAVPAGK